MLTIYRMQDMEGRGPWRPGFSHRWVDDRQDHDNLKPWPTQFGLAILENARGYVGCGCRNIEQLRRWFTRVEYARLIPLGFHAVTMLADDVLAESDIQLVFQRRAPLRRGVKRIALYPAAVLS